MAISNKAKWWIIGSIITIGAGVGAYFLFRKPTESDDDDKNKDKGTSGEPNVGANVKNETEATNVKPSTTTSSYYQPTGFTNNEEGNKFRKWVNCNHPDYAKKQDISCNVTFTNGYDNSFIRKAFHDYGAEYQSATSGFIPESHKNKFMGFSPQFSKLMNLWKNNAITFQSFDGEPNGNAYFSAKFHNNNKWLCTNWAYFFLHTPEYLDGTSKDSRPYIDVRIKQSNLGNQGWEAKGSVGKYYITVNDDGTYDLEGFEGRGKGSNIKNSNQIGTALASLTQITGFTWC